MTGCAAAYYLSRAGARVVLSDRFEIGTEGSGRNAGSLHGQLQHEPFSEMGEGWARSFLPALQFLVQSLKLWRGLSEELGVDLEVATHGGLLLVDSPKQMSVVERKIWYDRRAGIDAQLLTRSDLVEIAPWVSKKVAGAEYSPIEGKVNPMLATAAFAAAAVRAGTDIRPRSAITALEMTAADVRLHTRKGTIVADRVVLANGSDLAHHAASVGVHLPIAVAPVQVSATEPIEPLIQHLVYFAGERLTLKQARAGSVLIGGGWPGRSDPVSGYPLVDLQSLRANLSVAIKVAPILSQALLLRSWAGMGNGTPDHRPVLGILEVEPRVVIGLYPYMGITAGPLMGRTLADLVLGREPEVDLVPFRPERF